MARIQGHPESKSACFPSKRLLSVLLSRKVQNRSQNLTVPALESEPIITA